MAPALFFFFSVFSVSLLQSVFGQGSESCSPVRCGNVTIEFPFAIFGDQAAEKCGGVLGFQVLCSRNTPYLGHYKGVFWFQILDIFYGNSSLMIADVHKLQGFSGGSDHKGCHAPKANSSTKLGYPFSISPANQNLIFYNCTATPATAEEESLVETSCHNNTFVRVAESYDKSGSYGGYFLEGCDATVVPVLGVSGKTNASRYQELISNGFLLTWELPPLKPRSKTRTKTIMIVLMTAAGSLLLPCIYVLIWHRKGRKLCFFLDKRKGRSNERNIEAIISSHGSLAPKRYKYAEITNITSSFDTKLGEGGYGVVFKGMLHDGRLVAVKLLNDSRANGDEFVNEVMSIGRTSHVNIVSLFGFCLEGSKRALIYEYMPNGSLEKYIYSENPKSLGWEKLYAIAVGIARGLEYLHHSCNTRIVHFDIKPQNILLDQNFCPKIADFGLAKLCYTKESKLSMTGSRGTIGFIAPEVHSRTFGVVSTKSDVYSYGMMLLEMVGGRKNVKTMVDKSSQKYFPEWIYEHFAQDDGLQACEVTREVEEIAKKMSLIGLWCIQILPMHRPTITKVLEMFERGSHELDMPPKQNFSQILEDSAYNLSADGTSSNPSQTRAYSEMSKTKETSLSDSKNLQRLPTI